MGESPRTKATETTTKKTQTTTQAVMLLAGTALDATWRTLVPGIIGTVVGLILDHTFHTTPIIMIFGLVLGVALSVLLIKQQFKGLKK
jgi:F0F1-type ATP synthase assembly protein I